MATTVLQLNSGKQNRVAKMGQQGARCEERNIHLKCIQFNSLMLGKVTTFIDFRHWILEEVALKR